MPRHELQATGLPASELEVAQSQDQIMTGEYCQLGPDCDLLACRVLGVYLPQYLHLKVQTDWKRKNFFCAEVLEKDVYPRTSCHCRAVCRCAKLLEGAMQDTDGVIEVNRVHCQPLVHVLPRRQFNSLSDVPLPQGRINVPFQSQSLQVQNLCQGSPLWQNEEVSLE